MSPYGPYDNSTLGRFLQLVMRTFAIGTFFGVHVRMYWAAAILTPWFAMRALSGGGSTLVTVAQIAILCVGLFAVIWTHEMGHIAAGWRCGIRTDLITLSPLGGVAHMNAPANSPREELFVTLAGPAVHLVWLAVFWPLQLLLPAGIYTSEGGRLLAFAVWYLVTLNKWLLLFNLLPIFPLDGGRVLRSLLSFRVHPNRATLWATNVGIAGGLTIVLLGLFAAQFESMISILLGLSCISASLQERRMAKHVLIYHQARRAPWEADPDAWKHVGNANARRTRKPGWFTRWRRQRVARKAEAAAARQQALDREVDAVLERVHQVGMSGLDDREKAILKRASQRRRGTG